MIVCFDILASHATAGVGFLLGVYEGRFDGTGIGVALILTDIVLCGYLPHTIHRPRGFQVAVQMGKKPSENRHLTN